MAMLINGGEVKEREKVRANKKGDGGLSPSVSIADIKKAGDPVGNTGPVTI